MPYPELMVAPMREDMRSIGFTELQTAEQVDEFMAETKGVSIIVMNSVCGCAAGAARPAVALAVGSGEIEPDATVTCFAGQDVEATAKMRTYFEMFPPSSPSIIIAKDGQPADYIPRHRIEMRSADDIAADIVTAVKNAKGE